MMNKSSAFSVQTILSHTAYYLSGFLIISPLHKSGNIIISLLSAFIVSFILIKLLLRIFAASDHSKKRNSTISKLLLPAYIFFSLFISLMLLTEIIKDVSYIANKGVSFPYYFFIAVSILFVSFYLCTGKSSGIFRFLILSSGIFLILFFIMFFSLISVKSLNTSSISFSENPTNAVITGIKSGLFFTLDTAIFLFRFKDKVYKDISAVSKSLIISYIFIAIYSIFTVLIFGKLTSEISDPDYALIKLIPSIDLTEIISAVRIVSFLSKSSLYIHIAADYFKSSFSSLRLSKTALKAICYLLIPSSVLILGIFDKSLGYGAFQHLIYPVNILMVLSFILIYINSEKTQ